MVAGVMERSLRSLRSLVIKDAAAKRDYLISVKVLLLAYPQNLFILVHYIVSKADFGLLLRYLQGDNILHH